MKLLKAISILLGLAQNINVNCRSHLEDATAVHRYLLVTQSLLNIGGRGSRCETSDFGDVWTSKALDGQTAGRRGLLPRSSTRCCTGETRATLAIVAIVLLVGDNVDLRLSGVWLLREQGVGEALRVELSTRIGSGACGRSGATTGGACGKAVAFERTCPVL